jgi:hypothetical protein
MVSLLGPQFLNGHVISNVIFWLFFTQKKRLDGGFPRKDLGPL